jgi:DNA-binding NtrC family response regulator
MKRERATAVVPEGKVHRILVIDDEQTIRLTLESFLTRRGFCVVTSATARAGFQAMGEQRPDLVLLDLGLPDADGMDVLRKLREAYSDVPVLILTANDSLANAIESIKLGAFHFVSKPYAAEELLSLMTRALEQRRLVAETAELRAQQALLEERLRVMEKGAAPAFASRSMRQLEELLRRVAPTDANVLLVGESGVGKEVLAAKVHEWSQRAHAPMVKLNCAALPPNMIEAELFGYARGAFTGAVAEFPGMVSEASGGTLFLDEVAEMPPELQARFLRVLQEREYRSLGSTKVRKAEFRLIAATNRDLADALEAGTLRPDFYYRLNTFQIEIPPLRERREDIVPLAQAFLDRFAVRTGRGILRMSPDVVHALHAYAWPGNVRELQNAMEYAAILSEGDQVGLRQLPVEVRVSANVNAPAVRASKALSLAEAEKQTILRVLQQCHGNKKKAAEKLGIQRATLYAKLRQYGIYPPGLNMKAALEDKPVSEDVGP